MALHYLPTAQFASLLEQSGVAPEDIKDILYEPETISPVDCEPLDEQSAFDCNSEPIILLVNNIIKRAVAQDVYEIHIDSNGQDTVVRFRSANELYQVMTIPGSSHRAVVARVKLMAFMDQGDDVPGLGVMFIKWNGQNHSFKVLSIPTVRGERICLHRWRKFGNNRPTLDLDQLGMEPFVLPRYREACKKQGGAVIFTGPYDCGKTTTIFATMRELNSPHLNIMTGEYEIEHLLDGVNQSKASWSGPKGTTFGCRFKAAQQQNADIVLAKLEEFQNAIAGLRTACTGVSVFGSMHFADPFQVINYFRWNMPRRDYWLLYDGIKAIVSRRFIFVPCDHCKQVYRPTPSLLSQFGIDEAYLAKQQLSLALDDITFVKASGCEKCARNRTGLPGYQDMYTGIFEVLFFSAAVKDAIRKDAHGRQIREVAKEQGHFTLRDSALRKAILGETTLEQVVCLTCRS